jgi:hypothetical protein
MQKMWLLLAAQIVSFIVTRRNQAPGTFGAYNMRKITKPATRNVAKAAKASAAKPVKPATPANAEAPAASRFDAHRTTAKAFYSGDSLTVHSRKPGKAAAYLDRIRNNTHSTSVATARDESLLAVIHRNNNAGAFDPVALGADLGVISRLASLGYITVRGTGENATPALTNTGAERARIVANRKTA